MYLVAECMTMSAPSANGFCKTGVQKQLSTIINALCLCANADSKEMSPTSLNGLEGDSKNNALVLGAMAFSHA